MFPLGPGWNFGQQTQHRLRLDIPAEPDFHAPGGPYLRPDFRSVTAGHTQSLGMSRHGSGNPRTSLLGIIPIPCVGRVVGVVSFSILEEVIYRDAGHGREKNHRYRIDLAH